MTERLTDLATLTGVRSGKRSYYREFQRSNDRLQRTVTAMDSISRALVRTVEGPRALLTEIVRAASDHLEAPWLMLALADGALVDSRPRFLAIDRAGELYDDQTQLPRWLAAELAAVRTGRDGSLETEATVWVPMLLDGTSVGALVGQHGLRDDPEPADESVLRILANQAAVSMHTSDLYQAGLGLRRRAQQLYDEVSQQSRDLVVRTRELRAAEHRLRAADQRELLDEERHRIALELHDSVSQFVLSAGLAIDVCAADVAVLPGGTTAAERMQDAKDLTRKASEQLRSVIYALHHSRVADDVAGLPELLHEMAAQHRPHLEVVVRMEGRPVPLGTAVEHSLARTAGEALFNVAMHAEANRAILRLRYRPHDVTLLVSDDGSGNPSALRRQLRLSRRNGADGRHRGLPSMADRAQELHGTFSIRRSRLGGVRIEVKVPVSSSAEEGT